MLIEDNLYHFYNQGNNKELIFKERADYLRFLSKFQCLVLPHCDILSWVLMPNHFHFLIYISQKSIIPVELGNIVTNKINNGFRLLLSEYAQEFNKKYNRSGSLFRQKTKAKCLSEFTDKNYPLHCFNYIHQNPLKAGLVKKIEDWEFSSFPDFIGKRNGVICNQSLAKRLLGITTEYVKETAMITIDDKIKSELF
jgi:REP element-mobilizing transposase RayT